MKLSSRKDITSIYGAVGLKMARAALGYSQEEMSKLIGISKVTLARIETLESSPSLGTFLSAMKILESMGIELNLTGPAGSLEISVSAEAMNRAQETLLSPARRRSDRQKTD